jgi:integrase
MRKQLTEAAIQKLGAPPSGRLELFDSIVPGLAVRVTQNGAKSFVVRGRIKGRREPIRLTIGDALGMKLSDARDEASGVLKICRAGKDPREERRREKIAAQRADGLEFERVLDAFIDKHARKNRSCAETQGIFKRYVTPRWRGRLLGDIGREDVVTLLDNVEDKVSVYQANRTLAAVRKLMNWAVLRGMISSSPIVAGMARQGEESRTRYLNFHEIRLVWQATERVGYPFGPFFQLLLVTGQRRSEVAGALWKSFDLERERLWRLTPQEVKAGREHLVPLSDLALEILGKLPRINDPKSNEPIYVFTSMGSGPVSTGGKSKLALDRETLTVAREQTDKSESKLNRVKPLSAWRIHDLRRTVATHMEDALGIAPHIVRSVLNHSPHSYKGVTSVYTRGDLIFERRRALSAWARLLKLAIGREGQAEWGAIEQIMRPQTEQDAAATAEFRRMIQSDEAPWVRYLKDISRARAGNTAT